MADSVRLNFDQGYFICGNDVLDLPLCGTDLLIYITLTRYAGSKDQAWPSYKKIAEKAKCSDRRAKTGIKTLIECNLIKKETRKNKSNMYYVNSPKDYKPINRQKNSEPLSSQNNNIDDIDNVTFNNTTNTQGCELSSPPVVNSDHPPSDLRSPQGCTQITPPVISDHPIINSSISNIINLTHQHGSDGSERERTNLKKIKDEDIKEIERVFKNKGISVKEMFILELLKDYPVEEIRSAIVNTDFHAARNPLLVIKHNLKNNLVMLPASRATGTPEVKEAEVVDENQHRAFIEQARAMLERKVACASS